MITKSKERIELHERSVEYDIALLQQLKQVRRELAMLENVPPYIVLADSTLLELATYLPQTKDEFLKISGFGDVKIEKYGKHFRDVVATYCKKHRLASRLHLKEFGHTRNGRPERETETKHQSYDLFKKGFSIHQIGELRGLSIDAIESHLAFYLRRGQISITQLMETPRVSAIMNAIEKTQSPSMTPIKEMLGDTFTYGHIRMVKSHLEYLRRAEVVEDRA